MLKPKPHHFSSAYQLTVCQGEGTGRYWCVIYPENGKDPLYETDCYADRKDAVDAGWRWIDEATDRQYGAAMEEWHRKQDGDAA